MYIFAHFLYLKLSAAQVVDLIVIHRLFHIIHKGFTKCTYYSASKPANPLDKSLTIAPA